MVSIRQPGDIRNVPEKDALVLASAIIHAMKQNDPEAFIQGDPLGKSETVIDGHFEMRRVAEMVLQQLSRQPPSS